MSSEADKEYLRKHGIPTLFNEITQDLFRDRPEDPVVYLIDLLRKKREKREQAKESAQAEGGASGR